MNECRGCTVLRRGGSCSDPVRAGIAEAPIVAFAPPGYAKLCPARLEPGSTDAPPLRAMPPWGDKEISRFQFRVALFRRRGLTTDAAEELADRLALRDHERDDRRVCLECSSLQTGRRCFIAARRLNDEAGDYPDHLPLDVLPSTLQRCPYFTFQTP